MPGTSFNQGDIILINFPFSDFADGKVRPAIIISNHLANKTDVICAQITSKPHKDLLSFEIKDDDVSDILKGYSEIRCHKLFTAKKSIIKQKISHLHKTSHSKLLRQIQTVLEIK